MAKPSCSELSVDLGDALDALKKDIKKEIRRDLEMEQVHRMTGLGNIKFVPTAGEFSAVEFGAGIITIPASASFLTKLAAMPGVIAADGVAPALSRSILFALTTVGNLLTGGKSFLTGAMVGQIPSLLDILADWGASKIAAPKMAGMGRLGQTSEEEELRRLRQELERLSGLRESDAHIELEGDREDLQYYVRGRDGLSVVDPAEGAAEVFEPQTRRAMGRDVMVVR
jgi:hypothetical protein